jgi:hypothetical protein
LAPPLPALHRYSKYSSKRYNSSECFLKISYVFMGRFRKITKETRFITSVGPSFRPAVCLSFCPHGTTRLPLEGFLSSFILSIILKFVGNIQLSLECDKNKGHFYHCTVHLEDSLIIIHQQMH